MKKFNLSLYIVLFSHCIPVRGAKHSVIQDNQRERIVRVPGIIYEFITHCNRKTISESLEVFNEQTVNEILNYLIDEEFIFLTESLSQFPDDNEDYDYISSEGINNCILEYNPSLHGRYVNVARDLLKLGCKHLELRFDSSPDTSLMADVLDIFSNTRLLSIDIFLKYHSEGHCNDLFDLFTRYGFINQIIAHSAPDCYNSARTEGSNLTNGLIVTKQVIDYKYSCGNIGESFFSANIHSYRLSRQFNNCLYKKISITNCGSIKLCPSIKDVLGNICEDSFYHVAISSIQNEFAKITKSKVDTCKVCEFRYACSDCRAFLTNPEDKYSKPLKCGYDPYKGSWENWKDDPSKVEIFKQYMLS